MRNSEVMKALKAAFTGYERNSNAALLELLSDDFTFEMSGGGVSRFRRQQLCHGNGIVRGWRRRASVGRIGGHTVFH